MALHIGCQTYTWEMQEEQWQGTPEDILDTVAQAGYEGVEFTQAMLGPYADDPMGFQKACQQRGLRVAALAYAQEGFTQLEQTERDLAGAQKALAFSQTLGVILGLGGPASQLPDPTGSGLQVVIDFYNTVTSWGAEAGVTVCVHPHSHGGSLVQTAEEYDRLLAATAEAGLMFNPDVGHIVRGGHDLMDCLRKHSERIKHVHIKDVDERGEWRPLGGGIIDWRSVFEFLERISYQGWVVAEEESALAYENPCTAVKRNRDFLHGIGY